MAQSHGHPKCDPCPLPTACPGSGFCCPEAFQLGTDLQLEVHRQLTHNTSLPLPVSGTTKGQQNSTEHPRKERSWWQALLCRGESDPLQGTETQGGCSAPCPAIHQPSPLTRDKNETEQTHFTIHVTAPKAGLFSAFPSTLSHHS